MDFGWPNAKIGQKMANGQLLFIALYYHYMLTTFIEHLWYVKFQHLCLKQEDKLIE